MDSNENEEYNTANSDGTKRFVGPAGIGASCIAKAVSAAKYQNQFNNNNLLEQVNLMPAPRDRMPVTANDQEISKAAIIEVPAKDKVFGENGSSFNGCALFPQSTAPPSSTASGGCVKKENRLLSDQPNIECLTASFSATRNGAANAYGRVSLSSSDTASVNARTNGVHGDGPAEERVVEVSKSKSEDGPPVVPPDDGDFSDNNSIGNLSYLSENGLIEEIILLPNNVDSDDDNGSTSEDCIYAYRGGEPGGLAGQLLELRGDQPPDDETDFLEMDFDPEPSSEMENFDSHREPTLDDDDSAFAVCRSNEAHAAERMEKGSRDHSLLSSPQPAHHQANESLHPQQTHHHTDQMAHSDSTHLSANLELSAARGTLPEQLSTLKDEADGETKGNEIAAEAVGNLLASHEPPRTMDHPQAHKTGAIPKNVPHHYAAIALDQDRPPGRCSANCKNLKLDLNLCPTATNPYPYYDQRAYMDFGPPNGQTIRSELIAGVAEDEEEENNCLDCAEQEFLMDTKQDHTLQRLCRVCSVKGRRSGGRLSKVSSAPKLGGGRADGRKLSEFYAFDETAVRYDEARVCEESDAELNARAELIAFEALNKINALKETPASGGLSQADEHTYRRLRSSAGGGSGFTADVTDGSQPDQVVPLDYFQTVCPENTVTIYTINCGELTIIEALTRIGVAPNLDVLRQYFNEQYQVDTSKMNIPKYLLHMSKRDCNYKKLIEAIKSCCDDETLDVQYYPLDPFSDTPEIVQISSCEIAKRWNANTNLRQIIHFKHKHFHTLNVLGKIVNILRQPSRGRHTNHTISIPQYYKSGSITITRTAS
ncbi:uncharacterized protein LOC128271547 [Anopheles cruzii]|uniref:uncharacterized protein LOC128271547 n=1 Tax=Anopheles cruzii TaxID=68878 RepID=UPI0022EC7B80|nr:uncharacterized protein LOC128271547 [Anopheles cruzii]